MAFTYLASPYSAVGDASIAEAAFIREYRYQEAIRAFVYLFRSGIACFSPILHCHELSSCAKMPTDANFWSWYNQRILLAARSLHILTIPGWKESLGVSQEVEWARKHKKAVWKMEPQQDGTYTFRLA